jgi:hypothetical protein
MTKTFPLLRTNLQHLHINFSADLTFIFFRSCGPRNHLENVYKFREHSDSKGVQIGRQAQRELVLAVSPHTSGCDHSQPLKW